MSDLAEQLRTEPEHEIIRDDSGAVRGLEKSLAHQAAAEIDRLRAALQHEADCVEAAKAEIDRLTRERNEARAEREAMAKDAERFRWLLDQELPDWMDVYHQHPDRVRAAIDAKIEQERSEQAKERA